MRERGNAENNRGGRSREKERRNFKKGRLVPRRVAAGVWEDVSVMAPASLVLSQPAHPRRVPESGAFFRGLLSADQSLQNGLILDQQSRSLENRNLFLAEICQGTRDRFSGSANNLSDFFVGEGHLYAHSVRIRAFSVRPFKQQAGQAFRSAVRQAERANLLVGRLTVAAEVLRRLQAGIAMLLQEAQEIVALDEVQLTGLAGFGRNFVRGSGDGSMQAEQFSGLRDLEDQRLPSLEVVESLTLPLQSI